MKSTSTQSCADVHPGERAPRCKGCPFANKRGIPFHKPVRPTIVKRPIGILIGEGPGRDEVTQGTPFVGATGDELNAHLADNSLDRTRLIVINAMGCMPPVGQRNESNMRKSAAACRRWMRSIIRNAIGNASLPTLAMGKWAGYLATGKAKAIGNSRGFLRTAKRHDPLILTWHPTYALFRQKWVSADFLVDLDRFARAIRGELEPLPKLVIKPTLRQIRKLKLRKFLSLDLETGARTPDQPWTGKDPTQNTIKVIGLGKPNVGYSMWWARTPVEIKRVVRWILANKNILKVIQNGHWFDLRVLRRHGWKIRNVIDTRDMRRAMSTTSRLSLGYMSSVYLDFPDWKAAKDDGKE